MAFNRDNRSGGGRDSRGGGGRGFGGRSRFGGGNRGEDREMFKAVCANCGKECEVPFRPTGNKPVYCRDCFRAMGEGAGSRRSDDRGGARRPNFENHNSTPSRPQNKEQFEELNAKLDKILRLLDPEKSKSETPKITSDKNENVESVKKKEKVKKSPKAGEIVEIKAPIETKNPEETPTE